MTKEELETRLKEIGEYKEQPDGETTREELVNSLKHWERTRHLMIWSDHSSVMNHGHILFTLMQFMIQHFITPLKSLRERMSKKWWKNHKFT